jgi:hypothetical protein
MLPRRLSTIFSPFANWGGHCYCPLDNRIRLPLSLGYGNIYPWAEATK